MLFRSIVADPLVFLAQPDSIILAKEFADRNGVAVGGRVTLGTALGPRQFTVRGVMKSSGLTSAFGGNLAIMDVYAAQRMFGRGRAFDRVDLAVADGHAIADVRDVSLELLAERFAPVWDLCKKYGVTFDLECHPSERAMGDLESAGDYINFMCKKGYEGVVGFNLDGSHMEWQNVSVVQLDRKSTRLNSSH